MSIRGQWPVTHTQLKGNIKAALMALLSAFGSGVCCCTERECVSAISVLGASNMGFFKRESEQGVAGERGPGILRICPHCGKWFALRWLAAREEQEGDLAIDVYECKVCHSTTEFLRRGCGSPWWLERKE